MVDASLIGFVKMLRKLFAILLPRLYQQRDIYQLVGKTFTIHRKPAKIVKVFSRLTFVVYGIRLYYH